MKESLDELQKLFTEGSIDATQNYKRRKALYNGTDNSKVKMQIREEFKKEYDNWIKKTRESN